MHFCRTKAEPPIYYMPNKPLDGDAESIEKHKEEVVKLRNLICFGLCLIYRFESFDRYGQLSSISRVKSLIWMLFVVITWMFMNAFSRTHWI